MATVLMLTNSRDGLNTEVVKNAIIKAGHEAVRLDADRITRGEHFLTVHHSHGGHETIILETPQNSINLKSVDSVWFRRPYSFDFSIEDPVQRSVAEEEVRDIFEGIWELLSEKFWMSSAHAISRARLKVFQLTAARNVGLRVAESLITNSPEEAKVFCTAGMTVFKPIAGYHFEYEDKVYSALTTLLKDVHLNQLHLVRAQPVLLQRWIEKSYEVRATYVGGSFYSCRISCPGFEKVVDWREPEDFERLAYDVIKLPPEVEDKTHALLAHLGLVYAAVDFAVDPQGNYFFLEVNPVGQWLWIEHETGLPISEAISNLLINRGRR